MLSGGGPLLDQNNGLLTPSALSRPTNYLSSFFLTLSPYSLQLRDSTNLASGFCLADDIATEPKWNYVSRSSQCKSAITAPGEPGTERFIILQQAYYSLMSPAMTPVVHGHQAMTAPASLVFHRSGHVTPSGEYFSPLTSPALGPVVYPTNYDPQSLPENAGFHPSSLDRVSPPNDSGKRTTRTRKRRSSVDEPAPSKRIHSPVVKPTAPKPRPSTRASQVKTPSTRATRPRRGSANVPSGSGASPQSPGEFGLDTGMPQNTPSPVDLSMPPPSHPAPRRSGSPPPADSSHPIAPVTPGSIMNLGHMSTFTMTSRLSSQEERSPMLPTHPIISSSSATSDASTSARQETAPPATTKKTPRTKKGAGSTRSKVPPSSSSTVQNSPAIRPMVSPSLKPLLPEGKISF